MTYIEGEPRARLPLSLITQNYPSVSFLKVNLKVANVLRITESPLETEYHIRLRIYERGSG